MRWLHNISFSSSSSSSTSSSLSPHKRSSSSFSSSSMATEETLPSIRRGHGSRISRNNHRSLRLGGGGGDERPKLIRQRKLRHLTDQDLAGKKKAGGTTGSSCGFWCPSEVSFCFGCCAITASIARAFWRWGLEVAFAQGEASRWF
jgi:hypothetical protein